MATEKTLEGRLRPIFELWSLYYNLFAVTVIWVYGKFIGFDYIWSLSLSIVLGMYECNADC